MFHILFSSPFLSLYMCRCTPLWCSLSLIFWFSLKKTQRSTETKNSRLSTPVRAHLLDTIDRAEVKNVSFIVPARKSSGFFLLILQLTSKIHSTYWVKIVCGTLAFNYLIALIHMQSNDGIY